MIQSLGRDLGRGDHPGFAKTVRATFSGCQTGKIHGGSKLTYLMGQRNGVAWGYLVEFERRLICAMKAAGYFFDESEWLNIHFTKPTQRRRMVVMDRVTNKGGGVEFDVCASHHRPW